MGQAMVLPLDVQLEVLSCLEPREIGRVAAVSRLCHKADRTPLLWFHVYSRMFRGHLPAPPRFRDIRGGAATALPIKDFDWRTLTIRRAVIDADRFHLVSSELDIRAAPADRRGMVDTYLTGWEPNCARRAQTPAGPVAARPAPGVRRSMDCWRGVRGAR